MITSCSNTTLLDASIHSVHTPIPTTESEPLFPLSPNSIEQFPEVSVSSTATSKTKSKTAITITKTKNVNSHAIPSSMKCCPLPSPVVDDLDADDDLSSISSSSATTKTINTKSIRFSPMVRVKDVLSRHEMSLKERYDYWLQDHEFLMIKRRNQGMIQAIQESQDELEGCLESTTTTTTTARTTPKEQQQPQPFVHDDCLRGLESGLRNENLRKRSYRYAALEEVFLEQEDQYYAGIYDDEAIAQVYLDVTVECRFRAEFRGLQDRKEIEDYLLQSSSTTTTSTVATAAFEMHATTVPIESDDDEFAI